MKPSALPLILPVLTTTGGFAYGDLGQHQRAIENYDQAIRLDPNEAWFYFNRGFTYSDLGQNQQAIEDFNQAIHLNPNFVRAYNNRGIAYFQLAKYDRACNDFRKACELGDCESLNLAKKKSFCR